MANEAFNASLYCIHCCNTAKEMKDICQAYRDISHRTNELLYRSSRVDHQVLEETITDINMFQLKEEFPNQVLTKTMTKPEEGVNGADWEWWLTNSTKTMWLGVRVQAKIFNSAKASYKSLHYVNPKSSISQIDKLKNEAIRLGMVPLYCFYSYSTPGTVIPSIQCVTYPHSPEFYGCSLGTVQHVERLYAKNKATDYASVMKGVSPWHCLVCCQGYGNGTLPQRAWKWLTSHSGDYSEQYFEAENRRVKGSLEVGIRDNAPSYVQGILNNETEAEYPSNVGRVTIVIDGQA